MIFKKQVFLFGLICFWVLLLVGYPSGVAV